MASWYLLKDWMIHFKNKYLKDNHWDVSNHQSKIFIFIFLNISVSVILNFTLMSDDENVAGKQKIFG